MKILLIALGLFCASCVSLPQGEGPPILKATLVAQLIDDPAPTQIPVTEIPTPEPTPVPVFERTNWLLLGGDYRAHREGTEFGNKTDVIVLVSILETDPMDIAIVQFPRNLWIPIEGMDDQWLFAVWGREGWQGLHNYFLRAFGISLQGIHYINMDSFEQIVDELGGIPVSDFGPGSPFSTMNGAETLAHLRDNENNWDRGSYDAGQRVFRVLQGLWVRGSTFLLSDPVASANIVYSQWGDLFETDLSNIKQLYWLFRLGWRVKNSNYEIRFIQLEEPFIERGDTPIYQDEKPMRGMIEALDLEAWMLDCVLDRICEADQ